MFADSARCGQVRDYPCRITLIAVDSVYVTADCFHVWNVLRRNNKYLDSTARHGF